MFFDVTLVIDISTWFQKINVSFFLSGFKYHVILQLDIQKHYQLNLRIILLEIRVF